MLVLYAYPEVRSRILIVLTGEDFDLPLQIAAQNEVDDFDALSPFTRTAQKPSNRYSED